MFDIDRLIKLCSSIANGLSAENNIKNTMVSGSILILEGGSTNPLCVYADEEMTTPIPNPVQLDCEGMCDCFYIDCDGWFSYTLRNSRGDIIVIEEVNND